MKSQNVRKNDERKKHILEESFVKINLNVIELNELCICLRVLSVLEYKNQQ